MKNLKNFALGAAFSGILLSAGAISFAHLNTDNSVNMLYRMVMGREATSGEKSTSKNKEVDTLVNEIMGGGEYLTEVDKMVVDQYRWLLGRDPDPSGREFWKTRGPLELFRGIKNSTEYKNQAADFESNILNSTATLDLLNADLKFLSFQVVDLPSSIELPNQKQMNVNIRVINKTGSIITLDPSETVSLTLANHTDLVQINTASGVCRFTSMSDPITVDGNSSKDLCFSFVKPKEANSFILWATSSGGALDGTYFVFRNRYGWRILDPSANG